MALGITPPGTRGRDWHGLVGFRCGCSLSAPEANVGLPEQEAKEPMTKRTNNLTAAALRLTGIASMVAFVGAAAAAPRVMIVKAASIAPAAVAHHYTPV